MTALGRRISTRDHACLRYAYCTELLIATGACVGDGRQLPLKDVWDDERMLALLSIHYCTELLTATGSRQSETARCVWGRYYATPK